MYNNITANCICLAGFSYIIQYLPYYVEMQKAMKKPNPYLFYSWIFMHMLTVTPLVESKTWLEIKSPKKLIVTFFRLTAKIELMQFLASNYKRWVLDCEKYQIPH